MKVSIITITRNNAEGLRRTIESVRSQRHVHTLEHIIVDGESTDNTQQVIAEAGGSPKVVSRAPRGVYDAINGGLEHVTGDIIGLLHAGDVFTDRHVLDDVCAAFAEHPEADFIFGDVHFSASGGRVARYYSGHECNPATLMTGIYPPHPSMYIRRECQQKAGFYNADYVSAGDFEMFVRLFKVHGMKWHYIGRDMVRMKPGGVSATLYNRLWGNNRERMRAFRENGIKTSFFRIIPRYLHVIKSYLCRHPRK